MRPLKLLFAGFFCFFLACQKEPDETLTPATCKLDKILIHQGNSNPQDTISIEYSGEQVSRINYSDFYVVPEFFSNGLVARKKYYPRGTTDLMRIDQYTYNPDSTLAKVEAFAAGGGQQAPQPTYRYVFSWSAKQLTKLEFLADTSGTGVVPITEETFTYAGNNISQVIYLEHEDQYKDTTNFFYDSNLNYFQRNPVLILSDIFFMDFTGFAMAFSLSLNNVTSFDLNHPSTTTILTRSETDKQQIESLTVDGELYSRYQYKCQ
jgi:hypothetical protein